MCTEALFLMFNVIDKHANANNEQCRLKSTNDQNIKKLVNSKTFQNATALGICSIILLCGNVHSVNVSVVDKDSIYSVF